MSTHIAEQHLFSMLPSILPCFLLNIIVVFDFLGLRTQRDFFVGRDQVKQLFEFTHLVLRVDPTYFFQEIILRDL